MRIDIHNHFVPPFLIEQARRGQAIDNVVLQRQDGQEWMIHPQGYRYPLAAEFWNLEAKRKHMDRLGIDVSVLSVAPTLFFYWLEAEAASDFCRQTNEALSDFAAQSGGRIYAMATVPLQDPEAAAAELRRAVRELGMCGALIGTTVEHTPLDDRRFDPFFAAAAELDVPVVLHPYYVGMKTGFADFYMTNLVGNPLETGVAASRMILSGFLDRHPNLSVVLVHGGGFMPYQIGRLDHGFRVRPETKAHLDAPPSTYLRRFHFDTITHAAIPLKFLVELVGADRVLLGTDIPFDMADLHFTQHLADAGFDEQTLQAIYNDNAARLFHLPV
ncbi:MAG: amidohydrolase [Caldilineae bacterium]|nr:MAG: amidohydrolase [Caldilineae bacterium]